MAVLRGGFIDVAAPMMYTPRKRSDSAPPCSGLNRALDLEDYVSDQLYLASLYKRAQRLETPATLDLSGEGVQSNSTHSDSINTLEAASTDLQLHYEGDLGAQQSTNVVSEPITILMICDMPGHMTGFDLVDVIHQQGFSDAYDVICVPDPKELGAQSASRHNPGYAFLNFKTPEHATAFAHVFNDSYLGSAKKMPYTRPAHFQGLSAIAELKNMPSPGFLVCLNSDESFL